MVVGWWGRWHVVGFWDFRRVLVVELEGGTLTSSAGDLVSLLVRPFGVWNVGGVGGLVVGTLLGPERADHHPWGVILVVVWPLLLCQGLPVSRTAAAPVGVVGLAGSCGGCLVVR